jgi:hypothetical protein
LMSTNFLTILCLLTQINGSNEFFHPSGHPSTNKLSENSLIILSPHFITKFFLCQLGIIVTYFTLMKGCHNQQFTGEFISIADWSNGLSENSHHSLIIGGLKNTSW